jgi:hypothetical protein
MEQSVKLTELLRQWALEIETDGTPSQVGPTSRELRSVADAVAVLSEGLDRIAKGSWNNGAPMRMAARDYARRALTALSTENDDGR